ncbi:MAG: hemin-degrading factor [Thioalkalivibrionaceae bacterium]
MAMFDMSSQHGAEAAVTTGFLTGSIGPRLRPSRPGDTAEHPAEGHTRKSSSAARGNGDLAARWAHLRLQHPRLRIRDAAQVLDVSEAELVTTRLGEGVTRLRADFAEWLTRLEPVGEVMGLTRNEHAVHERHGVYSNARVFGSMGLLVNPDIDLRLFLSHWHALFHVVEGEGENQRKSFQVFGVDGLAIHKIYQTAATRHAVWDGLVEHLLDDDQSSPFQPLSLPQTRARLRDDEVDADGLRAHWDALRDTHDFVELLSRFEVGRLQALRLAGASRAWPVGIATVEQLLEYAADDDLPIMIFVGNRGIVQIHTGSVRRLCRTGDWFNVLDPKFNLHLRTTAIAESWVVRKPTVDGSVHSLELYDLSGELILQMFGARKPGQPEDPRWRALVNLCEPVACPVAEPRQALSSHAASAIACGDLTAAKATNPAASSMEKHDASA